MRGNPWGCRAAAVGKKLKPLISFAFEPPKRLRYDFIFCIDDASFLFVILNSLIKARMNCCRCNLRPRRIPFQPRFKFDPYALLYYSFLETSIYERDSFSQISQ
jgi:hypothetical protein